MAKKKLTANQKEYIRQVKLYNRRIRAYEKKYNIETGLKQSYELPKRVTKKTLSELKGQKRSQINTSYFERSGYNPVTGEIRTDQLPGDDAIADKIINNYLDELGGWNDTAQTVIRRWLGSQISEHGKIAVAQMLEDGARAGYIITNKIIYSEKEMNNYFVEMLKYLPIGADDTNSIINSLDEDRTQYEK